MKIAWQKSYQILPKSLRSKKTIAFLLILIIALYIGNRGGVSTGKIQSVYVQQKTIESQVVASGVIRSKKESTLRFQTAGKLASINADQGDFVKRGQIIASLDTKELQKRLAKDLNLYFKTRLDFDELKDTQNNQVITDTLKRIAEKSQADLDNSVIDVQLRDLAIKFSNLTSPIDGYVVDKPKFVVGENIFPTDTILTVADLGTLQFAAEVDETEIAKINTGQKAYISLDAFGDDKIETQIKLISPKAITSSTGATVFEVFFDLSLKEGLRLGMNGQATIITSTAQDVLVVPKDAIIDDKFVWVKTANNFQKKEITKGIESDTDVEITSRLSQNQEIVTSGFEEIGKKSLIQKFLERLT